MEPGVRDRLTSTWCTLGNVYQYGKKFTMTRLLLQRSPHLTFFSTFVSVTYTCELLFRSPSTFCDLDIPPRCEARSQL
nr:hypothetical transcript [Hymenolepis microstoma]